MDEFSDRLVAVDHLYAEPATAQPSIEVDWSSWASAATDSGRTKATRALDDLREVAGGGGLNRSALFQLAADASWPALHLGTLVWGYGSDGLGNIVKSNALRDLGANDPAQVAEACVAAKSSAREGWNALWPEDRTSAIVGLRVAMGTKLLYFAGYRSCEGLRPLIYDKRVHRTPSKPSLSTWPSPTTSLEKISSVGQTTTSRTFGVAIKPRRSSGSRRMTSSTGSSARTGSREPDTVRSIVSREGDLSTTPRSPRRRADRGPVVTRRTWL